MYMDMVYILFCIYYAHRRRSYRSSRRRSSRRSRSRRESRRGLRLFDRRRYRSRLRSRSRRGLRSRSLRRGGSVGLNACLEAWSLFLRDLSKSMLYDSSSSNEGASSVSRYWRFCSRSSTPPKPPRWRRLVTVALRQLSDSLETLWEKSTCMRWSSIRTPCILK